MSSEHSRAGGRAAALVPAAGRGERLGGGVPKALRELDGEPILVRAVRGLGAGAVDLVVIAAPEVDVERVQGWFAADAVPVTVVAGGATRQESVLRALAALPADVEVVLVHDAARPLVPPSVVDAVVDAVRAGAAAVIPGIGVADTIKSVEGGRVTATLDRSRLVAVQTPQGFSRALLERAHAESPQGAEATDDASLVERLGVPVTVIEGSPEAFKITRPLDLVLAEALLAERRRSGVR